MNERDFLSLAHLLAARTEEAAWRSAISRGYYAAFHVARLLLEDLGFIVPRADRAHSYLWLRLANCGEVTVRDAGSKLNLLRRQRNQADYDLVAPFTQGFAQGQVRTAESIVQALDTAALEPTRSQIADVMKIYERDVLRDVTWRP